MYRFEDVILRLADNNQTIIKPSEIIAIQQMTVALSVTLRNNNIMSITYASEAMAAEDKVRLEMIINPTSTFGDKFNDILHKRLSETQVQEEPDEDALNMNITAAGNNARSGRSRRKKPVSATTASSDSSSESTEESSS